MDVFIESLLCTSLWCDSELCLLFAVLECSGRCTAVQKHKPRKALISSFPYTGLMLKGLICEVLGPSDWTSFVWHRKSAPVFNAVRLPILSSSPSHDNSSTGILIAMGFEVPAYDADKFYAIYGRRRINILKFLGLTRGEKLDSI